MNRIISLLTFMVVCLTGFAQSPIEDCKCKGIELYGNVLFVTENEHPDLRIKVVGALYPKGEIDLRVELFGRTALVNECGQWAKQERGDSYKFSVAVVEHNYDFVVQFVNHWEVDVESLK